MSTAIVYTEFGGPEVLHPIEVPEPEPGEGQLTVRIAAAAVNPIDAKLRARVRPSPEISRPRRVGIDGAGTVTAVGAGVEGYRVGDPVVVVGAAGTYATDMVVAVERVFRRPPAVSVEVAAAMGTPVATAYQALRSLAVGPGDTLLLHAGSGAVGQAAIQWAVMWGARVIATTSEARADRVRALGAHPVAYGDGLVGRMREIAVGEATVALDAAGTDEALEASRELVRDRSRIATLVRGADAEGFGIRAFGGGSPVPLTERQQAWRREGVAATLPLLGAGAFSVEVGERLPLEQAVQAHRLLERRTGGKILLIP